MKNFKIKPMRNKNGKVLTNKECCRFYLEQLEEIKKKSPSDFYQIIGGSQNEEEVMGFFKQVEDATDEQANIYLRDYLINK